MCGGHAADRVVLSPLRGAAALPGRRLLGVSRPRLAFERAWAPFAYTGPARAVVLGLKGRGLTCVTSYMAAADRARAPAGVLEGVLVPAPAHPERIRRHGHNQAA